jgi:ABC-2 type transport system ATP-binding protein
MSLIIEVSDLNKQYGSKRALQDVTFSLEPGVVGLLGPNGSGKSTLIKALLGLVKVLSGSVSVLGKPVPQEVRWVRDHVGYLPEDDCFISGLTGIESVHLMARLAGLTLREGLRRSHEILDYADIGQERYRAVETYSTGMRQKLKFAQALVHDPRLLILDEPTNGLDPGQRVLMLDRIKTLAHQFGKSIILSTHILHDVQACCQAVVILAGGRVKRTDRLENLSRPARDGIQVTLRDHPGRFLEELRRGGMEAELQSDGTVWVHEPKNDTGRELMRIAQSVGNIVIGIRPAKHSLEQIFMEAIRLTEHATA